MTENTTEQRTSDSRVIIDVLKWWWTISPRLLITAPLFLFFTAWFLFWSGPAFLCDFGLYSDVINPGCQKLFFTPGSIGEAIFFVSYQAVTWLPLIPFYLIYWIWERHANLSRIMKIFASIGGILLWLVAFVGLEFVTITLHILLRPVK